MFTQEEIIDLLKEVDVTPHAIRPTGWMGHVKVFERFAALVADKAAAREREAAAQVCDAAELIADPTPAETAAVRQCAVAIRARAQKGGV